MANILNTFYYLYKSNAKEVVEGNKAIEKSSKDAQRALDETDKDTKRVGESFVKMVESAAGAAGAYAGFNILKNGVQNAIQYNAQLQVMARLHGQNAQLLKTIGQLAAEAGGTREGGVNDIMGIIVAAQQRGVSNLDVGKYLSDLRARIKQTPNDAQRNNILNSAGINDPGLMLALKGTDAQVNALIKSASSVSRLSNEEAADALATRANQEHLTGAQQTFFTRLSSTIEPLLNAITNLISTITGVAGGSGAGSLVGGAAVIGGSAVGLRAVAKGGMRLLGIGGRAAATEAAAGGAVAAGAATATSPLLVAGGTLIAGTAAGYMATDYLSDPITRALTKWQLRGTGISPDMANGKLGGGAPLTGAMQTVEQRGMDDRAFWKSKGYSDDDVAAIMSSIKHESNGDPNARGDSGLAMGIAQWHPDRRAAILKATGIDVSNASYQQQLEAMAWEMKNGNIGFDDAKFRSLNGAFAKGAYFSTNFERPLDKVGQAVARGQTALGIANQFMTSGAGAGGGGTSISIDKIDINTQATDANGIAKDLRQEIYHQLNMVQANSDDGVAR